jgi:hypothetical protein
MRKKTPNSKEASNFNTQNLSVTDWSLVIGISLEFGVWNLGF